MKGEKEKRIYCSLDFLLIKSDVRKASYVASSLGTQSI